MKTLKNLTMITAVLLSINVSCFKGPMIFEQDSATQDLLSVSIIDADEDGVSGSFLGSSRTAQYLSIDLGDLEGTSIIVPPGALAVDTVISIAKGVDLTSSSSELGGSYSFVSAGSPVAVVSQNDIDLLSPLTLEIPLGSSSLLSLSEDPYANLVVMYKIKKAANQEYELGVIPRNEFRVENSKVILQTQYFGVFQPVYNNSTTPIEKKVAVKTESTVLTIKEQINATILDIVSITPPNNTQNTDYHNVTITINFNTQVDTSTIKYGYNVKVEKFEVYATTTTSILLLISPVSWNWEDEQKTLVMQFSNLSIASKYKITVDGRSYPIRATNNTYYTSKKESYFYTADGIFNTINNNISLGTELTTGYPKLAIDAKDNIIAAAVNISSSKLKVYLNNNTPQSVTVSGTINKFDISISNDNIYIGYDKYEYPNYKIYISTITLNGSITELSDQSATSQLSQLKLIGNKLYALDNNSTLYYYNGSSWNSYTCNSSCSSSTDYYDLLISDKIYVSQYNQVASLDFNNTNNMYNYITYNNMPYSTSWIILDYNFSKTYKIIYSVYQSPDSVLYIKNPSQSYPTAVTSCYTSHYNTKLVTDNSGNTNIFVLCNSTLNIYRYYYLTTLATDTSLKPIYTISSVTAFDIVPDINTGRILIGYITSQNNSGSTTYYLNYVRFE